jgi:F0F1-type ATP synthase membrane subunit b/b'
MARKIFSWTLIVLSATFLLLSVIGIVVAWVCNDPLTREVTGQLKGIDDQLVQAQVALDSSQMELARALRFVNAAQVALETLAQQSTTAGNILDNIQNALDDRLLPELKTTRERINAARNALDDLRSLLPALGSLPFMDINIPDQILTDLIASADSLDSEIANAEEITRRASMFVSNTSYLPGGDLTETRESLKKFLAVVEEYQSKVADWRTQIADLNESLPLWIDRASIILTVFLLWFGLSQLSLLLHGRMSLRGDSPLDALRSR